MVTDDANSPRARLAAAAKTVKPFGRRKPNSKTEQVRGVVDLLEDYRRRYPQSTAADLQRLCAEAGIEATAQVIRDVLKGKS